MQKKIIALAVAGLVSGAAFAQSNVTVYGIIDMAYVYRGDSTVDGQDDHNGLDDGGWDSSRFGLKGSEDLGNGLALNFKQEYQTKVDTAGNAIKNRNSWVGFSGKNWGAVQIGSMGSVHDDYLGITESGGMSWGKDAGVELLVTGDIGNAIEYISPSFSGLQFKAGLSSNYDQTEDDDKDKSVDGDFENDRAVFGSVAYDNGPLKLALTFDTVNEQNTDAAKDEWMAAAAYDFGMFKVGAAYDRATLDDFESTEEELTRDAWRLNFGVPIGAAGNLGLTYVDVSTEWGDRDQDISSWGISYSHALSKRTHLYAAGYSGDFDDSYVLDNAKTKILPSGNWESGLGSTSYETGFKVGVRHLF